jgi:multiple sugar transport system substrate-binding protein
MLGVPFHFLVKKPLSLFIDESLLFYNKLIFDKFGVRYPGLGSTYDDVYKLAQRLTRQDGLDHYKGYMQHPDNYLVMNQLGVYPFVPGSSEQPAPEDVRVNLTSPEWKTLAQWVGARANIRRSFSKPWCSIMMV